MKTSPPFSAPPTPRLAFAGPGCEGPVRQTGDKRPFKGDPKAEVYEEYAHYSHIHHAVGVLKEIEAEMKEASHNYGGPREEALAETHAAVKQLNLCIEYAKEKK